jgi:hypothetical protein
LKQLLKKHLINLRGKSINENIVVIESDDWGSIRIPNKDAQNQLLLDGLIHPKDPFSLYDCLECSDDYHALYAVLDRFKDIRGRSPVITVNMVMGNPNFEKIKVSNFLEYYWETFDVTYKNYYPNSTPFPILMAGINEGFLFPQFHAREHLNALQWLQRLYNGDKKFHQAFDLKCFAINDSDYYNLRTNLMASYDYKSDDELAFIESSITQGLTLFRETFGFNSSTTIAPCYVWNNRIEQIFNKNKVQGIQGSYVHLLNNHSTNKHHRIWHTHGSVNELGQLYTIRNVLFEPALDISFDWVSNAMESISIAFFWRKPAIISSHRINYVAGLSQNNRENTLNQLQELLAEILKKWPNVIFMNSAELNEYYKRF